MPWPIGHGTIPCAKSNMGTDEIMQAAISPTCFCAQLQQRHRALRKAVFVLIQCMLLMATTFAAGAQQRMLGEGFSELQQVGEDQAQVVYYRDSDAGRSSVANVYLDREFITALQPGGYTSFCVAAGSHVMGAYIDDAPRYAGKNDELYQAGFKGGKTYYLKVREDGDKKPLPVARKDAQAELVLSRQQVHLVSRATNVEPCRHYGFLDRPAFTRRELVLRADDAFTSRGLLTAFGRSSLNTFVGELRGQNARLLRTAVEGHADPLGTPAQNQRQAQVWADAARDGLVASGIAQALVVSHSAGSRQPVAQDCYGNREQQVLCHAANRRVVIRADIQTEQQP